MDLLSYARKKTTKNAVVTIILPRSHRTAPIKKYTNELGMAMQSIKSIPYASRYFILIFTALIRYKDDHA